MKRTRIFLLAGVLVFVLGAVFAISNFRSGHRQLELVGIGSNFGLNSNLNADVVVGIPKLAATLSPDAVLISGVPFIEKKPDFGGEACIAMFLQHLRYDVDQDFVFDQAGVDPLLGRGCITKELVNAAKQIGFEPGPVWFSSQQISEQQFWDAAVADLENGIASVVCRRRDGSDEFVLLIGYDAATGQAVIHSPGERDGESQQVDAKEFVQSCKLGSTYVRLVLRPTDNRLRAVRFDQGFTDADYAQHIRKLKTRLPDDSFHVVIQKPFVVIGDRTPAQVEKTAAGTVKWAVDRIKLDYFTQDPHHIIDVWLFKSKPSYDKHNKILWNTEPGTPFGYYSPTHRVLVMNIQTGGGTLVHEIVHPFMESNFQNCPDWFNEGLASLYEQSRDEDGHIMGSTNWRLRGLQLAIEDGRVPTFEDLCSTTTREFYDGASTNYAQARYLCYFLQEQGKLVNYYHEFVKNSDNDPTGHKTLQRILGESDMADFQRRWEAYVTKLRFR